MRFQNARKIFNVDTLGVGPRSASVENVVESKQPNGQPPAWRVGASGHPHLPHVSGGDEEPAHADLAHAGRASLAPRRRLRPQGHPSLPPLHQRGDPQVRHPAVPQRCQLPDQRNFSRLVPTSTPVNWRSPPPPKLANTRGLRCDVYLSCQCQVLSYCSVSSFFFYYFLYCVTFGNSLNRQIKIFICCWL